MIPSDALLASLCGAIYKPTALIGEWDYFDLGEDDGVCWALKRLSGYDAIVLRGSITAEDWIRDFRAAALPSRIGWVHDGFYAGMEHMWHDARSLLKQPVIVTGHSLGAARASILTALMVSDGEPPAERVVFGEPRPGLESHAAITRKVTGRSYCNGYAGHSDTVCSVPFSLPGLEFTRATPLIPVSAPPLPNDNWGLFAFHHIELYEAATSALAIQENIL